MSNSARDDARSSGVPSAPASPPNGGNGGTNTHSMVSDATAPAATAQNFRLTPMAARKVHEALLKRGTPRAALRVGVRGGGCSGFSYVIEFADGAPAARDLVFTFPVEGRDEPVRVLCDKKSIIYLNGSVLDWEKTLMFQGFKFKNPHEKSSCGCSSSFSV